jgi:hypothetical protein
MPSSHLVLDQVEVAFDDERAVASAGCCCRQRWPSGWGSSRPPTSWSISAAGRARPVLAASY